MQTLDAFNQRFPTEDACRQYVKDMRWPDGKVTCPRCGNDKVYELKARPFNWVCKSGKESVNKETGEVLTCAKQNGYRFSVITHTIFENTKRPLRSWFKIGYLMLTSARKAFQRAPASPDDVRTEAPEQLPHDLVSVHETARRDEGFAVGRTGDHGLGIDEVYLGGKEANKHRKPDATAKPDRTAKRP